MAGTRSGAHHPVRAGVAVLVLVAGLGACQGDNLFKNNPPVTEGPPLVRNLVVPAAVFEGDVIPVRVEAVARRGLDEVEIQYAGAINTQEIIGYPFGTDSVVVNTSIQIFQRQDSLLIVTALARDVTGRISNSLTDTVRVNPVPLLSGARE